jgi:hypothetical protein
MEQPKKGIFDATAQDLGTISMQISQVRKNCLQLSSNTLAVYIELENSQYSPNQMSGNEL